MLFKDKTDVRRISGTNIIQVGHKRQTAELVERFYTKNPFPNYNEFEGVHDLEKKVMENQFLSNLKKSLGFGKRIIEVGSGTSQLSIALANGTNNELVAFDSTLESLRMGSAFAEKHEIKNCTFVNGDLFSDPFQEAQFDVVWCSGMLHHTESAERGFEIILKWLKPEEYVILGLYNLYGRIRTVFRQLLYKFLGKGKFARFLVSLLDPVLRSNISSSKKKAWFQDQYEHPVESLHTLDEVLRWFDSCGVEFISSIPMCDASSVVYEDMFSKKIRGSRDTRFFSQLCMIFSPLGREGGLFLVIGKKKSL